MFGIDVFCVGVAMPWFAVDVSYASILRQPAMIARWTSAMLRASEVHRPLVGGIGWTFRRILDDFVETIFMNEVQETYSAATGQVLRR